MTIDRINLSQTLRPLHWAFAVLLFFTANLYAQSDNHQWYRIEVIIFKQSSYDSEQWQQVDAPTVEWPKGLQTFKQNAATTIVTDNQLQSEANRIANNPNRSILWHRSWLQQLRLFGQSDWLLVRGGEENRDRFELEGALKIQRSRYLHIYINLWLNEFDHQYNDNIISISLPPYPSNINKVDCPNYQHMPIWLRTQLYAINLYDYLNNNKQWLWQSALSHRIVDPIEHRLHQLQTNWQLQLPPIESQCAMDYSGNQIIDWTRDSSQGNRYLPLVLKAEQKIKNALQATALNYEMAFKIPEDIKKIIYQLDGIDYQTNAKVIAVYPFNDSQKLLLNRVYYLDHPKFAVLVQIERSKFNSEN